MENEIQLTNRGCAYFDVAVCKQHFDIFYTNKTTI